MRTLLIALVVGLLIGFGAASQTKVAAQQPNSIGRYQIVINPQMRADTFLLDTATGRVWTPGRYVAFEGEPRVWELEAKADSEHELQAILKAKGLKKQ